MGFNSGFKGLILFDFLPQVTYGVTSRLGTIGIFFAVCSGIETNFISEAHLSTFFRFGVLPEDGGNSTVPNDMICKEGQRENFVYGFYLAISLRLFKVQVIL